MTDDAGDDEPAPDDTDRSGDASLDPDDSVGTPGPDDSVETSDPEDAGAGSRADSPRTPAAQSDGDAAAPTDEERDHDAATDSPPRVGGSHRDSGRGPRPRPGSRAAGSETGFLTRFRTAESGPLLFIRETLYSAVAVLAVGLLLFAISGVWPPMVAVESGSMEPEMHRGDLVLVTEPQRFTPDYAGDTGIVTVEIGSENGYRSFGGNGSVIIFDPPDRTGSPIIHRAHLHVEEGENWYDRANPAYMNAENCEALANCPAPHEGFITKGDANARYDQASNIAGPVRSSWIRGTARLRIPYLGYIRLKLAGALAV